MLLRSPRSLVAILGTLFLTSATPVHAQSGQVETGQARLANRQPVPASWQQLNREQRSMVDLLAADFFNRSLTPSQRGVIAGATADSYANASPEEQHRFRQQRRATWQKLTPVDRALIQTMPQPRFEHLTDSQKAPFRRIAIQELGLMAPIRHSSRPTV